LKSLIFQFLTSIQQRQNSKFKNKGLYQRQPSFSFADKAIIRSSPPKCLSKKLSASPEILHQARTTRSRTPGASSRGTMHGSSSWGASTAGGFPSVGIWRWKPRQMLYAGEPVHRTASPRPDCLTNALARLNKRSPFGYGSFVATQAIASRLGRANPPAALFHRLRGLT
jgi:hypothetical protein